MSTKPYRSLPDRPSLNPVQLIEHARVVADDVSSGRYPFIEYTTESRWHQRLYRDPRFDIWLISWLPTQGTQLHDHGGSCGAFAVLSGRLDEAVYRRGPITGSLTEFRRAAGAAVGFGTRYVHDVRNLSDAPAVSVHAYSPPLTSMNFYDITDDGRLQKLVTLATNNPEPGLDGNATQRVSAQPDAAAAS